jgi:hypothetical protein
VRVPGENVTLSEADRSVSASALAGAVSRLDEEGEGKWILTPIRQFPGLSTAYLAHGPPDGMPASSVSPGRTAV